MIRALLRLWREGSELRDQARALKATNDMLQAEIDFIVSLSVEDRVDYFFGEWRQQCARQRRGGA